MINDEDDEVHCRDRELVTAPQNHVTPCRRGVDQVLRTPCLKKTVACFNLL